MPLPSSSVLTKSSSILEWHCLTLFLQRVVGSSNHTWNCHETLKWYIVQATQWTCMEKLQNQPICIVPLSVSGNHLHSPPMSRKRKGQAHLWFALEAPGNINIIIITNWTSVSLLFDRQQSKLDWPYYIAVGNPIQLTITDAIVWMTHFSHNSQALKIWNMQRSSLSSPNWMSISSLFDWQQSKPNWPYYIAAGNPI
jgi:hypothetical protein